MLREDFPCKGGTPGELVGLPNTQVLGLRRTRLRKVEPKQSFHLVLLQERPAGPRGARTGKRLYSALAVVQQMSWKQSLRKMKMEFSRPLNPPLPFQPGTLTALRCNTLIRSQYCPSGTGLKPQSNFQQTT